MQTLPLPQTAELVEIPTEFHCTDFAGVFPQMSAQQVRAPATTRHAPKAAVVPYGAGRVEAFQKMMSDEGFVLELARLV
jgi:hypothetical protein